MSLHIELADHVDRNFGEHLSRPVEHKQDALVVHLDNGVTLTARYAANDAYSLRWTYGDLELGIDTAPLHRELATFPNHLHDGNGQARPDPLTRPELAPAENISLLIHALLADPSLGLG
ncbi:hypothetical protein LLG90_14730 [Aromatoleum toluclasticum]|uniref:hypothetical protein n=1 Tax=Aromatoleum toluclasticum TaxID=92003 RepID=UPI001D189CB2|nr:hypothetical protein [Aromatoleum toluclasticum]MCC4116616.1 hypothetical protein [Aromatoleum toluclasticum]